MPVVKLYYDDLEQLTGVSKDVILERLPMLGADIERIEEDHAAVEFFPNRPDLFSVEGVARAMRGFLGLECGLPRFEVKASDVEMFVDASVKDVRPYVVCALVRNLELDSRAIESLMQLQEHLHWGLGRNRAKVSIGVHDFSRVKPPFRYLATTPDLRFVPLDFDEEMSMREILERHPKGVAFGFILEGFDRYPLIRDAEGNVLSFPPIINAELTRVTEETRDVFIEVTGTDEAGISLALNIIVCALAERGGEIHSVAVHDATTKITPNLEARKMRVRVSEAAKLIGVQLTAETAKECCERLRLGAEILGDDELEVSIPAYRTDIMHPWDIIEDIAIGYGYENIGGELPSTVTVGEIHPTEERKALARDVMTGLGYLEVMTFTLTSEDRQFTKMRRPQPPSLLRVASPITTEHTMLRVSLLPSLLEVLSMNRHYELPQRIFEVGAVFPPPSFEERQSLAAVSMHADADFAEIRALVDAVLRELPAASVRFVPSEDRAFLEGRRGNIMVGGVKVGVFGELHPEVLENFELVHPVVGFELDLDAIFENGR
ncbi:MAG TPA: phenylalanine--tRNA ligase subunit beta [Methanomicrobia archaeon]|nr:phenylalanine--tRNA ligase subunit beta [Methanomicrobia archaeon]HEX58948.1 phenylalanine--tRNA ligase subunit beta [Methanomicrobia archaeon]